ncbi:MAG: hypothetical protein AAGA28_05045, partial [Pseudomonadota bacterium]
HMSETTIVIGVVGGTNRNGTPRYTLNEAQNEAINALLQVLADALNVPLEVHDKVDETRLWIEKHPEEIAEAERDALALTPDEELEAEQEAFEETLNAEHT